MPSLTFAEKYRASTYGDIIGQDKAIQEVKNFLKQFPKRKSILLYGPAGTGKTSLVLTAAKEHDLDIFELNSSDLRNRIKLEEVLKPASIQQSLFKKGKLILMDEIDGVTGTDIGGVPELIRIIEKTSHPLILTGNDIWHSKFSGLRRKCKLVEMKEIKIEDVIRILYRVLEKEDITENSNLIKQIAIKSQGDVRAALNDLQTFVVEKTDSIDYIDKREKEDSIFNILKMIFQERKDFLDILNNTSMSLDEVLLWIEENIPREYKGEALAKAYYSLSNADKFRGRIYRQQFWRFLIYQNIFETAGISYAKSIPKSGFVKYERPSRILKIWINNQKTAKKKTISQKYAKLVHCSVKRIMKEFNTVKLIVKNSPEIQQKLKLTEEEIDFVMK